MQLENIRPVNVQDGTRAVFHVLSRHLDRGQTVKVRDSLPEDIRRSLWPEGFLEEAPSRQTGPQKASSVLIGIFLVLLGGAFAVDLITYCPIFVADR